MHDLNQGLLKAKGGLIAPGIFPEERGRKNDREAREYLRCCRSSLWLRGPHLGAGPYRSDAVPTQASGQCKLVAMGAETGTFAFGRPAFVAGAAIGSAI